jgi:hypothetical protein
MDSDLKYFVYNNIKFPYFNKKVNDNGIKVSFSLLFLNTFGYGAVEIGNLLETNNHACAETLDISGAESFNYFDRNVICIEKITDFPNAINVINTIKKNSKNYLIVWTKGKNLGLDYICDRTFENVGIITNLETLL